MGSSRARAATRVTQRHAATALHCFAYIGGAQSNTLRGEGASALSVNMNPLVPEGASCRTYPATASGRCDSGLSVVVLTHSTFQPGVPKSDA